MMLSVKGMDDVVIWKCDIPKELSRITQRNVNVPMIRGDLQKKVLCDLHKIYLYALMVKEREKYKACCAVT